ncbi:MAG: hypothetical protein L0220_00240 [Acidobacteria bacterium]|nr:hypothetical protein [Acidobacteriota bacterium]
MYRQALSVIVIITLFFVAEHFVAGAAQLNRNKYGPVVTAYLTALEEEVSELVYQLNHREISRSDYQRSRQRLGLLRRFVEQRAATSREDFVPELEVLSEAEFGTVGLKGKANPKELKPGDLIDGRWRLLGVERGKTRIFVIERLELAERKSFENSGTEQKPVKKIDPLDLIETIVVPENKGIRP